MKLLITAIFLFTFLPSTSHGSVSFFEIPEKTLKSVKQRREAAEKTRKKPTSTLMGEEASSSGEPDALSRMLEMIGKKMEEWTHKGEGGKDRDGDDPMKSPMSFLERFKKQKEDVEKVIDKALQTQA